MIYYINYFFMLFSLLIICNKNQWADNLRKNKLQVASKEKPTSYLSKLGNVYKNVLMFSVAVVYDTIQWGKYHFKFNKYLVLTFAGTNIIVIGGVILYKNHLNKTINKNSSVIIAAKLP